MRYRFEDCLLDTDRRELRRGADAVSVQPQVFDLLVFLIRNRDRVVSKDDVINAIWNGRAVSDAALTTRLNAARTAIGDTGEKQQLIKTLPRKGFRFVAAVQEDQGRSFENAGPPADSAAPVAAASAQRLSIVVLPFANIGSDPVQDYFADGITDSLTTDLSRIRDAFVIGGSTAFTLKGRAVDAKRIGRDLNVRYVLEGSVQRGDKRIRVNVQLIDAETGNHLWAERFDKPLADLLDMQDEIVSRLANTLDAELVVAEARRAQRSQHPDAKDLYFQGTACLYRGMTYQYLTQARGFFERALALDAGCIEALIRKAEADATLASAFLVEQPAPLLEAAEAALSEALSLDPQNALAHLHLGVVLLMTGRAAQGIAEFERALVLDRNRAHAHGWIGLAKVYLGRALEAEAHVNEALRLSPRDTAAFSWQMVVGAAKLHLNAEREAIVWLRRSIETNRNNPLAYFFLADALTRIGAVDEAKAAVKAALVIAPGFTIRRLRANARSDHPAFLAGRERMYEGLRLAGVPEG